MKALNPFPPISQGERLPLILLFIHAFLNGLALLFFETTANTLFLTTYETSDLPYVYIVTAVISVLFGLLYGKIEEKLAVKSVLKFLVSLVLAIVIGFYLILKLTHYDLSSMGIMIFKDMVTMVMGIEFGIVASTIFDIRQGKRLFGLLVSGEILAGMIGGVCIGWLLTFISTVDLLLISGCAVVLSLLLLIVILNLFKDKFSSVTDEEDGTENEESGSYRALLSNRYYQIFFIVSLLAFFVFYFIDYIFYLKIEEKYTTEEELAGFFGIFYAILNGVNLISSLFVSGKVLSRFGIGLGLLTMPVLAVVGTSSLVGAMAVSLSLGFTILVVLKIFNEVIDISILTPSFRVLYQSMPANQKNKVLAFRETIIEPSAMGFAGILLLVISSLEGIDVICGAIIAMGAVWYFLGGKLKELYFISLKKLLDNRYVVSDETLFESLEQKMILQKLESDDEIDVLYAMEVLKKFDTTLLDNVLFILLSHQSQKVRLMTLKIIRELHKIEYLEALKQRIRLESDLVVLGELLDVYSYLGECDVNDDIYPLLEHTEVIIQDKAIASLMKYGGIDGILVAGQKMNSLFDHSGSQQKIRALKLLRVIGISGGYRLLREAMKSEDIKLKQVAIETIGHLKLRRLVDDVVDKLDDEHFKMVAVKSLILFGRDIFPLMVSLFDQTKHSDKKALIIKIISSMKTKESEDFLIENLQNSSLFFHIIEALFMDHYKINNNRLIQHLLQSNFERIIEESSCKESLDKTTYNNTHLVLTECVKKRVHCLFLILGLYYPKYLIHQAKANFLSNSDNQKAFSIELLDNLIDPMYKEYVIPILENPESHGTKQFESETVLLSLMNDDSFPLIAKISAIYEIGKGCDTSFDEAIKNLCRSENSLVQETALWAYDKLSKGVKCC